MQRNVALIGVLFFSTLAVWTCTKKEPTKPKKEFGSLGITSRPTGAKIFVDGTDTKAVTPDTLTGIPAGIRTLRLTYAGYADFFDTVRVLPNQIVSVNACLEQSFGYLIVISIPDSAQIFLDSVNTGFLTPDTLERIAVGTHSLLLKKPGYVDFTQTVTIRANEATTIHATLTVRCPGEVVGDTTKPPTVQIAPPLPGATIIYGFANNVDARYVKVQVWALTDLWYIQFFTDRPFVDICGDGSWSRQVRTWDRLLIMLVDTRVYVHPGSPQRYHPAENGGPGVLAWIEYLPVGPNRPLVFSGRPWIVKVTGDRDSTRRVGPGPNYWSDSPDNTFVDLQGRLHLKLTIRNGKPYAAEVLLKESLGLGRYTVQVDSRLDSADFYNVISPLFTFESNVRESDFEVGGDSLIPGPHDAQFVVQPSEDPGHKQTFVMAPVEQSTFSMLWCTDRIEFVCWRGHGPYPPRLEDIIFAWTYTAGPGRVIPPPGNERLHMNVWPRGGRLPRNGQEAELIIKSFTFTP